MQIGASLGSIFGQKLHMLLVVVTESSLDKAFAHLCMEEPESWRNRLMVAASPKRTVIKYTSCQHHNS